MNASVPTGFREVVGIPCGHVILVDSSSKVTIFSRGFRRSAFGGGGGQSTVFDGDRLIIVGAEIGISKSVIPAILNSLTDLGTKYSNRFSGFPVDRRIGAFLWKYDLRGSEL